MQLAVAILTILFSGLVSVIVTHRLTTSHQERLFRREKLEQLYTAMDSFCTTFIAVNVAWPSVMRGEMDYNEALDLQIKMLSEKKAEELHRSIQMLVNIYFPMLLWPLNKVFQCRDAVNKLQLTFKNLYKNHGPTRESREFIDPFLAALAAFEEAQTRFNEQLFRIAITVARSRILPS